MADEEGRKKKELNETLALDANKQKEFEDKVKNIKSKESIRPCKEDFEDFVVIYRDNFHASGR